MDLIKAIIAGWSWLGCKPQTIVAHSPFGNVVFMDMDGAYWRLIPESLKCEVIAGNREAFEALWSTEDFQEDWKAVRFCDMARSVNGELDEGRSYCLKLKDVLGGQYAVENMGTIGTTELIESSGHMAFQIKDLPDGTPFKITITR